MKTAGAKKGEAKARAKEVAKQTHVRQSKRTIRDFSKLFEDEFKKGNQKGINKLFKNLAKVIKNQKDLNKKEIGVFNLRNLLADLRARGVIKGFALNEKTGMFSIFGTTSTTKPIITIDISDIASEFAGLKQLEGIGLGAVVTPVVDTKFEFKRRLLEQKQEKQKDIFTTRTQSLQEQLNKLKQNEKQTTIPLLKQSLKNQQKQIQKQMQRQGQVQRQGQLLLQKQLQTQKQLLKQRQKLKLKRVQRFRQPRIPKLPTGLPPVPPFPKLKKKIKKKIKKIPVKKLGWNAFAKQRGKFLKLNRVPLRKSHAKSLSSFLVDTSVSRSFKIKKTNKPFQTPKTKFPLGYFGKTKHKYRPFKIRKKQKIPISNFWIEKVAHAIDSKSEKQQLSLARRLAEIRRKKIKKSFKGDGSLMSKRLRRKRK